MLLKRSQKSEIAQIMTRKGFSPSLDFNVIEDEEKNIFIIQSNNLNNAFFEITVATSSRFGIVFAPSEVTLKPTGLGAMQWSQMMGYLENWVGYVKDEIDAEDPWDTIEQSETFEGPDTKFTESELSKIDAAVDASFEKLLSVAQDNNINKTIDDIREDIKNLKDQARKKTRIKWLELFKEVIAEKLIEWGLGVALGAPIIQIFFEMAKPILKLVASSR